MRHGRWSDVACGAVEGGWFGSSASTDPGAFAPRGPRDEVRVDTEPDPPCGFIAAAVDLAMMNWQRHGELIAHFGPSARGCAERR